MRFALRPSQEILILILQKRQISRPQEVNVALVTQGTKSLIAHLLRP